MTGGGPARTTAALALLTVLGAVGCGYSLRGGGGLPSHLRTVAVPTVANRTSQPHVEAIVTRALVQAFSTDGRLQVVRPADADAILEGEVTRYELQSIAFDPAANVRQYRLVVTMNVRLRDVRENRILYERGGVQERADFRVPASASQNVVQEQAALGRAAVDIGRAVVSFALEHF